MKETNEIILDETGSKFIDQDNTQWTVNHRVYGGLEPTYLCYCDNKDRTGHFTAREIVNFIQNS